MLKRIKATLLVKILSLFVGIFFTLFLVAYVLVKNFLSEHMQINELNTFMYEFNIIWFKLLILFLFLTTLMYYLLHFIGTKIENDISSINIYLDEVNKKNYDAIIKIENYVEFLHSSLLLKNIVKRLQSKDKK